MGIKGAGRIHVPRRTVPVEREGQGCPAGLRAQFFLPDIVAPATTRLTDTTAHHQHVDDAAVGHVHVIPMVQTGTEDDHRLAVGLFRIARELARDGDDLVRGNTGDLLGPGRGVRHVVGKIFRRPFATKATVKAIVGAEQIEHRGNQRLTVRQFDALDRHVAGQHVRMLAFHEMLGCRTAEIGEVNPDNLVMVALGDQRKLQLGIGIASAFLKVPRTLFTPAESDGAVRCDNCFRHLVDGDGLPVRVVGLAQLVGEFIGAHEASGDQLAVFLVEPHEHRHVGILAGIILKVSGLPVEVELAQDHMAHRHGKRRVRARLWGQPDVAELCGLGIVGADDRRLGATIAGLGVEMRVRGAGLRHVGPPEQQEARVEPVGAFRHVGLLAPGLRAGRWQVAIPVVERHADPAQQAQIPRTGGIADHRHRRDRRKTEHPVRPVSLGGVGVGGGDDLGRFVPGGPDEPALATGLDIGRPQDRILLEFGPGINRRHGLAHFAPDFHQLAPDQRVFHPVGRIEIPTVGRAARTAARFVIGQVGARARIVGLLRLPCDDARLDVDFPRTRPGAVHPMGRAHDLVVTPALPIGVFPVAVVARDLSMTIRELLQLIRLEEV